MKPCPQKADTAATNGSRSDAISSRLSNPARATQSPPTCNKDRPHELCGTDRRASLSKGRGSMPTASNAKVGCRQEQQGRDKSYREVKGSLAPPRCLRLQQPFNEAQSHLAFDMSRGAQAHEACRRTSARWKGTDPYAKACSRARCCCLRDLAIFAAVVGLEDLRTSSPVPNDPTSKEQVYGGPQR